MKHLIDKVRKHNIQAGVLREFLHKELPVAAIEACYDVETMLRKQIDVIQEIREELETTEAKRLYKLGECCDG